MRSLIFVLGLLCFNLYAQDDISIPEMVETQCMYCHADHQMPMAPMMTGQDKEFLEFELFNFRDYVRDDETMNQVMEDFTDAEVKEIAQYLSGLSICNAQAKVEFDPSANLVNGEKTFKASCIECHKKDTSGLGPIIHGQKAYYLENAIKSFQSDWYEPRPSRINMRNHTDMLSDQDIKDVAAYLNKQKLCE
jgi:cytochrome c553